MSGMEIDFDSLTTEPTTTTTAEFTLSDVNDHHPETSRLIAELDRKKSNRLLFVPTKDAEVRSRLRQFAEPITLFGERAEDRRDRLREFLGRLRDRIKADKERNGQNGESADDDDDDREDDDEDSGDEDEQEKEEEFYTEGSQALKEARRYIAEWSIPRARKRIERQRLESNVKLSRLMDVRRSIYANLKTFTNLGSQIGDTRPLGNLRFSPDSSMLLTSSWTGLAKLWNVPSCKEIRTLKAHKERIGGVAWHPEATLSQSSASVNFATSGADNDIKLWSLDGSEPLSTLSGHAARVCRIAFHPSGRYLGSASYDGTFRLWSTETSQELLLQEGHSKEVYSVGFQPDGSLACTGGLDAIGRVWDLRSGRTAMVLDGHVKDILAIEFAPNGHQIVSGSNDDTIRVWDLRALKSVYTIPAHKSAVSDLSFFKCQNDRNLPKAFKGLSAFEGKDDLDLEEGDVPLSGSFLVSAGYDGAVKIWSADDWQLVKSLSTDTQGKIMGVDVSSDARFIASAEYSRTFKLWSNPDVDLS